MAKNSPERKGMNRTLPRDETARILGEAAAGIHCASCAKVATLAIQWLSEGMEHDNEHILTILENLEHCPRRNDADND